MVKESFTDKVTRAKHEEGEGKDPVNIWQNGIPGRGEGKCKGPVAEVSSECTSKGEKARRLERRE